MRIGIAIARAATIDATWTTVHLAAAALKRGWAVRFIEPWDFEVGVGGRVLARAHAFDPDSRITAADIAVALSTREASRRFVDIARLDLLLLRVAPLRPSVMTFAMLAKSLGVSVVNDPAGLLLVSHKAWLASIDGAKVPPTLVTRSRAAAHLFYEQQRSGVVVKPARGSGGKAVSRVLTGEPGDLDEAFEEATAVGDAYVVLQAYLPAAEDGEKRLVVVDGEILGGYLRMRGDDEFRHNLKRGAMALTTEVTQTDVQVVNSISPAMREAGIRFAGLDVIGDHLIEVNALNPGGTYHSDRLHGTHLSEAVLERLVFPAKTRKGTA